MKKKALFWRLRERHSNVSTAGAQWQAHSTWNVSKPRSSAASNNMERRVAKPDPPQQEHGRNLTDYEMARWRQYFEAHVAEAIETERDFMIEVVGLSLGERENQLREEIRQFVDGKFRKVPHGPPGDRGETGPIGPQGEPGFLASAGTKVIQASAAR